jgi:hypothetical protein
MPSLRSRLALSALALSVVAAPAVVFAAPSPPKAPNPPTPNAPAFHTVDLEIVDVGADKKSITTRFSVVVAEGWGMAHLGTVVAPYDYDVSVHCDPALGGKLPLSVEIRRHDARPGAPGNLFISTGAVTAPSTRVSIGSVARSDGGSTEVTLRAQ